MSAWNDPDNKPAAPWNEWDDFGGCWVCNRCGAAAGFQVHSQTCYHLLTPSQQEVTDHLHALIDLKVQMGRRAEVQDLDGVRALFNEGVFHYSALTKFIKESKT